MHPPAAENQQALLSQHPSIIDFSHSTWKQICALLQFYSKNTGKFIFSILFSFSNTNVNQTMATIYWIDIDDFGKKKNTDEYIALKRKISKCIGIITCSVEKKDKWMEWFWQEYALFVQWHAHEKFKTKWYQHRYTIIYSFVVFW